MRGSAFEGGPPARSPHTPTLFPPGEGAAERSSAGPAARRFARLAQGLAKAEGGAIAESDPAVIAPDQILDFAPGTDKIGLGRIDADAHEAAPSPLAAGDFIL